MSETLDVTACIVGAGPVGATLAAATSDLERAAKIPGTSWAIDPITNKVAVTADGTDDIARLAGRGVRAFHQRQVAAFRCAKQGLEVGARVIGNHRAPPSASQRPVLIHWIVRPVERSSRWAPPEKPSMTGSEAMPAH